MRLWVFKRRLLSERGMTLLGIFLLMSLKRLYPGVGYNTFLLPPYFAMMKKVFWEVGIRLPGWRLLVWSWLEPIAAECAWQGGKHSKHLQTLTEQLNLLRKEIGYSFGLEQLLALAVGAKLITCTIYVVILLTNGLLGKTIREFLLSWKTPTTCLIRLPETSLLERNKCKPNIRPESCSCKLMRRRESPRPARKKQAAAGISHGGIWILFQRGSQRRQSLWWSLVWSSTRPRARKDRRFWRGSTFGFRCLGSSRRENYSLLTWTAAIMCSWLATPWSWK